MTNTNILKIADVKVGDKVIARHSSGSSLFPNSKDYIKGKVYTVTRIQGNMVFTDNDNGWHYAQFGVVEKPKYEIGKKYVKDHPDYNQEKKALTCVAYNGEEPIFQHKNGTYIGLNTLQLKLIPLPEKKSGTVWVNVYENYCITYKNKELADRTESSRLACIEVKWTEGQGL